MYDKDLKTQCIIILKETIMSIFETIMHKILIFEKEPQKIGLSQLKDTPIVKQNEPSIKNKNVKLSDLMRRASQIIKYILQNIFNLKRIIIFKMYGANFGTKNRQEPLIKKVVFKEKR